MSPSSSARGDVPRPPPLHTPRSRAPAACRRPRRPSGRTGATAALGPAAALHPAAQLPPPLPRPAGDPFSEPPEPRHPRGVALDEKLEFFRTVLKQKEETLARARALYEQRDLESARLREVALALHAQAEEVLPQY